MGQAAATPPPTAPTTPAPTAPALGLGFTPPPVTPAPTLAANVLTQPGTGLGLPGKPQGFGGFGDPATPPPAAATPAPTAPTLGTPAPTAPIALGTALGGGLPSASNSLAGAQQPKGITTGLGSASGATPPPTMVWNGKMPGGSGDPSANGRWWGQPGGPGSATGSPGG